MHTGYYLDEDDIYGPRGYTEHYIDVDDGHICSRRGDTGYRVARQAIYERGKVPFFIYGPRGYTHYYIDAGGIFGPEQRLPWT